jgi:small subunit ribosomal protein S4e
MLILMQRLIQVDAKVRTDVNFPTGYQDVITIEKTGEHFRMLLDTKGRFTPKKINNDEAAFKLCRVRKVGRGNKGVPFIVTHDGRTIRYPDPNVKPNDTVKIDLSKNQDIDYVHFDIGNIAMCTGGKNIGRIGLIVSREKHPGSFDIIHLKDAAGRDYATRMGNVFVIGKGNKPWISLPKGGGVKLTIQQEAQKRLEKI